MSVRGEDRSQTVAREDLLLFLNASFAATGQAEFYEDGQQQGMSIDFVHEYMLGNYRRLYARTLALAINDFARAQVIVRLLATGKQTPPDFRAEEGELLRAGLRRLPAQRVYKLFRTLARRRVNNRRTRALVRDYLRDRSDPVFDAVKYRGKVRNAVAHAHLATDGELGRFLFSPLSKAKPFTTPLLETYRQAGFSEAKIYELPFTVAEGFAAARGVPRERFLAGIEPRLTDAERLRVQAAAERSRKRPGSPVPIDLGTARLTRLCLYLLSLNLDERAARRDEFMAALEQSSGRAVGRRPQRLGRVACVLDRSYSCSGSREKARRPLAVALGADAVLQACAREYRAFWTRSLDDPLALAARGQTNLADPVLDALAWRPDLLVIVSDGFENDPPETTHRVLEAWRRDLDPQRSVAWVHFNPVYEGVGFEPRRLGSSVPTLGVRDAEDIPALLAFARFSDGSSTLSELEAFLAERVEVLLR